MSIFYELKAEIAKELENFKIRDNDIAYVALDVNYWLSYQAFISLQEKPKVWSDMDFNIHQFESWRLPKGFQIVMKDFRALKYRACLDPYYSQWDLQEVLCRPKKQYLISRENHSQDIDH